MNLKKKWNDHLKENNMGYTQHLFFALLYSYLCLMASIYLLLHAFFPCFFQNAGSDLVRMMALVFKKRAKIDDT